MPSTTHPHIPWPQSIYLSVLLQVFSDCRYRKQATVPRAASCLGRQDGRQLSRKAIQIRPAASHRSLRAQSRRPVSVHARSKTAGCSAIWGVSASKTNIFTSLFFPLQMQSNQEARARSTLSLFDLSQRGNGQALRNTFINGEAVRISGTSKLPMEVGNLSRCFCRSLMRAQGEFELDYSTFKRPPADVEAVSDFTADYEITVRFGSFFFFCLYDQHFATGGAVERFENVELQRYII